MFYSNFLYIKLHLVILSFFTVKTFQVGRFYTFYKFGNIVSWLVVHISEPILEWPNWSCQERTKIVVDI